MKLNKYIAPKALWLMLFCMGICRAVHAQQDAQFSQYMFNGLYINPAFAGYKQDVYVNAFYRSQWTGLEGAPQTFSLAADGAVNDAKVGLGLLLTQDRIGAQSSFAGYANYAYRLQIGYDEDSRLSFGIGAGFVQNGLDGSKLHAVQADDNYIPTGNQSVILPDARLGILYTNKRFFAGVSIDNVLSRVANGVKDKSIMTPVPVPHFYLTGGTIFDVNEQTKVRPSFMIKDDFKGPTSLDINLFTLLGERIWIGGTYRTAVTLYNKPKLQNGLQKSNALIGVVEVFATDRLRVGYAFDYSLTPLQNYSYGSHELSIGIYLHSGNREPSYSKCYFN
ncbi:PorP/SprF family type IX secretion system membrane protein [Mucilaginibacter lacusdianchii]|uniref:PorP/SprF family type IX secretion system membrane protein n=1 Tax=Mucilaginibacter lacusdianchii TaxID=2684211 RepID=UPI00131B7CBF|nr:type IX secretion system membrane protein PorP/SprF [Mucilaginibacter sp. JXJ CY 39]